MISIRELQSGDDLTPVLTLCREFFYEYENHHWEYFDVDPIRDDAISGRFLQSIKSETGVTFIALDNDAIVGYAAVDIRKQAPFYTIKEVGVIWGLMVASDHRRKGIASRLLAEVKTWFERHEIKYFTAYTAVTNDSAIMFYERNGMTALQTSLIGKVNESSDGDVK